MTRKHFIRIAAAFATANSNATTKEERATIDRLAREMADTFAGINPRFDRGRFLTVCYKD